MFNVDHLYSILYSNLLQKHNLQGLVLKQFGKCETSKDIIPYPETPLFTHEDVYFYDQEPLGFSTKIPQSMYDVIRNLQEDRWDLKYNIWATSEKNNPLLDSFCKKNSLVKWYYFYHAFASLDWLRSVQYMPRVNIYEGASFISLNNLCDGPRVYRPLFVAKLYQQGLLGDGIVSYNAGDFSNNTFLSDKDRELLSKFSGYYRLQTSSYIKDNASAEMEHNLWTSAFWHIVSETCYYEKTNHLTEKTFKPIASRQPFIILGTPGSLKYLKSYGFESFSTVIDESYDSITDPVERMDAVVTEVKKLSSLNQTDKKDMYNEILPIIQHNYEHFYNGLFDLCWEELTTNFKDALDTISDRQEPVTKDIRISTLDKEILSYSALSGNFGRLFRDKFKTLLPKD